jgi:hypothetical protein
MYYRSLLPLILLIAVSASAFAEVIRPIVGKVYEQETGQPLPGASISVKETKRSVISDLDGSYRISAEVGQTLIFAYTGLSTKEVMVTVNGANLDVELSVDSRQLTEVVITGALGIKRSSRELGASAQLVDTESLNEGKTVNPLFGLTSKVAG